jgi:alpha-tubulin suppressor-like RCC1 family protein
VRAGRVAGCDAGVCSFAVDNTGALWAWGASKRGQLGLGRDVLASAVPRVNAAVTPPSLLVANESIHAVECGIHWGWY